MITHSNVDVKTNKNCACRRISCARCSRMQALNFLFPGAGIKTRRHLIVDHCPSHLLT